LSLRDILPVTSSAAIMLRLLISARSLSTSRTLASIMSMSIFLPVYLCPGAPPGSASMALSITGTAASEKSTCNVLPSCSIVYWALLLSFTRNLTRESLS